MLGLSAAVAAKRLGSRAAIIQGYARASAGPAAEAQDAIRTRARFSPGRRIATPGVYLQVGLPPSPQVSGERIAMRMLVVIVGWILTALGGLLVLAGLLSLPDGGLMFALPYVFLLPGLVFVGLGALALRFRQQKPPPDSKR